MLEPVVMALGLALIGAAILGAGVCIGLWFAVRQTKQLQSANQRLLDNLAETTARVFVMKGLHPHLADPRQFAPNGHGRQEADEGAGAIVEAEGVDFDEETAEDIAEYRASMQKQWAEWDAARKQRQQQK